MNEALLNVIQKDLPAFLQQLDEKRSAPRPEGMLQKKDIAYLETLQGNRREQQEQISLYLILAYSNYAIGEQRMAIHYFEQAFTLSDDYFPQGAVLAKAYLDALHTVVAQTGDLSLLSNGLEWAEKFEFITLNTHKELAAIYYQAKDYDTAASLWTQHLQQVPDCVTTCHLLIKTLSDLRRYEAAVAIFKHAPSSVQQVASLQLLAGHCYKETGEYAEAEKLYKAAMAAPYSAKCQPMCALAELYAESLTDHHIAHTWYQQAVDQKGSSYDLLHAKISYLCFLVNQRQTTAALSLLLFMEQQLNYNYLRLSARDLNRVAWCLYILNTRLDQAAKFSRRAVEQNPHVMDHVHTLVAILIRIREWNEVTPHVRHWLKFSDDEVVKASWSDYSLLFQDTIMQDQQATMEALLYDQTSDCWRAIRCALYKTSEYGETVVIPDDIYPIADQLYKQFIFRDMPRIFPG
jgi:tetratricopeptide (TPR) repeat protein